MRLHVPITATLLLAAVSPAQTKTVTVPAIHDSTEATGSAFWLGAPFDSRRQLLIDKRHLKEHGGSLITAVTMRRNAELATRLDGGRLWVEIAVSNSSVATDEPSVVFAQNRGPDHTTVFARYVNFPSAAAPSAAPAPWRSPFAVSLNFAKPFKYLGRTLVVETVTRLRKANEKSSPAAPWWVADAVVDAPAGTALAYGTSCIARMPGQPAGANAATLAVGATATFYLHGGVRSGFAIFTLGLRQTSIDLTPLGATGCHLYTDWLLLRLAALDAMPGGHHSQARAFLPLPADDGLVGANLFTQWSLVDLAANRIGLTFSNGVRATIGRPTDSGTAWIESSGTTAAIGRVLFGRFPVLRFSVRKP